MRDIRNEPLPAVIVMVQLKDGTTAIFDGYICNGEMVCLIDKDDHHRYVVSASQVVGA